MTSTLEGNYFDSEDLVFDQKAGKSGIYGGGFRFDSVLKNHGISPIQTRNQTGGNIQQVSDLFKSLVVPTQLAYPPNSRVMAMEQMGGGEKSVVEDKLWNQLLDLARVQPEKVKKPITSPPSKQSRKKRSQGNRKTKKHISLKTI